VRQDQQQQQQPQQQEEETAPPCQLQKTSNYINLQLYESCDEANIKEVRKATNVFVINPVDKSTFFETVTASWAAIFLLKATPSVKLLKFGSGEDAAGRMRIQPSLAIAN
jgi:hypothetical protein